MKMFRTKSQRRTPAAPRTKVSFSADDLAALSRYLSTGVAVLHSIHPEPTHPVIARIKAAMTRLGQPVPKGL